MNMTGWWVQKSGTRIKMSDMDDTHLVNSILMAERGISKLIHAMGLQMGPATYYKVGSNAYCDLLAEARRRESLVPFLVERKLRGLPT